MFPSPHIRRKIEWPNRISAHPLPKNIQTSPIQPNIRPQKFLLLAGKQQNWSKTLELEWICADLWCICAAACWVNAASIQWGSGWFYVLTAFLGRSSSIYDYIIMYVYIYYCIRQFFVREHVPVFLSLTLLQSYVIFMSLNPWGVFCLAEVVFTAARKFLLIQAAGPVIFPTQQDIAQQAILLV